MPAPSHSDFFTGIALPAGGEARRAPGDLPAEGLELLERMAQRRRHVQAILDRAEQDPTTALRLLAQTDDLTRGLDTAGAAQVIYGLADRYARSGHGEMAAETFQLLTERYPDDPLARPALTWLVQYYAGSETAHRAQSSKWQDRLARAAALGRQIEPARPELFAEPALRFPLAAALRQQGQSREAERLCRTVGRGPGRDPWSACAQGELWLAQPKGPSPKTVLPCVAATERPRLDGVLDDAVWQRAKPAALASTLRDDAAWPATVMLAHDAEFLYVAIRCRLAPGARYEPAAGQRPRDGDLSAHDRVDILLDLDRDYATYYRLTIDHRGWTGDSCWGDRTWDPTWYVAARTADGQWTAEAAIPLDQLSERRPAARTVWAIGIQRTVPGVGFQSWTAPASISVVPEGFGYLLFE